MQFNRKFSMSTYKNMRIKLGEMTFFKDFISDTRGDLYPVRSKSEICDERIVENEYHVSCGAVERMICQFFPYATYELSFSVTEGEIGFCFSLPDTDAYITVGDGRLSFSCGDRREQAELPEGFYPTATLLVSCRPGAFDVYFRNREKPEYFCTFREERFADANLCSVFSRSRVLLRAVGRVTVTEVLSYMDNGIALADIRPVKYENGSAILEGGRIYFTASIRMQEGSYQGVFSWVPGTAEIDLTGVVFYDCGDGRWRNFVAPVILYHREKRLWYVWVSSFEYQHLLAYASFEGDPRFGVNVIDVTLMEEGGEDAPISSFVGFYRDEDPDLFYDEEEQRWLLAICRMDPATRSYVYVFFESHDPFAGYRYIGRGRDGAETGGSFVRLGGALCFVCGNDFKKTSEYRIYNRRGMTLADFDYPDGGFRGWGSVIPVVMGSRTRYFWLTFDRERGSDYTWSYGNLYCFELAEA